jgi:glucose-6-phosphate-specific signal transduction histidine kinase
MDGKNRETVKTLSARVRHLEDLIALGMSREKLDQLGQLAVQINMQLELAEALQERDPDSCRRSLKQARSLATDLLEDIRQAFAARTTPEMYV